MAYCQVDAQQVTNIGRNVLAMDDYLLAIQYFNQAIKSKPYLSDPYYYRGLAKIYLGDFQGAEEDCTLAIERNKYRYDAYKVRGVSRIRLNKGQEAIEDFNLGLYYQPNDRDLLYYKALQLTKTGAYSEADSTFQTLQKHYPTFENGLSAYSHMLTQKGDSVAAYKVLLEARKKYPKLIMPYLLSAELEQSNSQWADAIISLDEAIKLKPRDVSFYINRAFYRYNLEDAEGAYRDYKIAEALDPENKVVLHNLSVLNKQPKFPANGITLSIDELDTYFSSKQYSKTPLSFLTINPNINYDVAFIPNEKRNGASTEDKGPEIYQPLPPYSLTFIDSTDDLHPRSNFIRELDKINSSGKSYYKIYLNNDFTSLSNNNYLTELFAYSDFLDNKERRNEIEPLDYLIRGIVRCLLKNYEGALEDLDKAIEGNSQFSIPYFQRSFVILALEAAKERINLSNPNITDRGSLILNENQRKSTYTKALDDLNSTLKINSRNTFAWYNKGIIYYELKEFDEALNCFDEAIKLNPDFGNSWYNRALTLYALDKRDEAVRNLSKAGELGVVNAYKILKYIASESIISN